eukprot:28546-Eustigmatos_ZCMA.PRE.1
MAGADELVLGLIPGHDATEVGAHGIEAVCRVTLEPLSRAEGGRRQSKVSAGENAIGTDPLCTLHDDADLPH